MHPLLFDLLLDAGHLREYLELVKVRAVSSPFDLCNSALEAIVQPSTPGISSTMQARKCLDSMEGRAAKLLSIAKEIAISASWALEEVKDVYLRCRRVLGVVDPQLLTISCNCIAARWRRGSRVEFSSCYFSHSRGALLLMPL
jgi:hypothetical protein